MPVFFCHLLSNSQLRGHELASQRIVGPNQDAVVDEDGEEETPSGWDCLSSFGTLDHLRFARARLLHTMETCLS